MLWEKAQEKELNQEEGLTASVKPILAGHSAVSVNVRFTILCITKGRSWFKCNGKLKQYHLDGVPDVPAQSLMVKQLPQKSKRIIEMLQNKDQMRKAIDDIGSLDAGRKNWKLYSPITEQISQLQEKQNLLLFMLMGRYHTKSINAKLMN